MARTKLAFLGIPTFSHAGQPVALTSAKGIALLAYLAANGAQPRERLTDLLWPDSLPDAARKNLRNTLWQIRSALDEAIVTEGDRLTLSLALWVDSHALKSDDADPFALYRGPFLDALALTDAPDMELWIAGERERLLGRFRTLVQRRVERLRAQGDWQPLAERAGEALIHDPYQESFHVALIEAHARLGQRAEALRAYDAMRERIEHDLGAPLLPESLALRDAILDGSLRVPEPTTTATVRRAATSVPFVGRAAERAALDVEIAAVQAHQKMRVVLLVGETGIGKSRLWQEWSAGIRGEWPLLESHATAATQELPLAPLATLVAHSPPLRAIWSQAGSLMPIWLADLARLVPDVRLAHPTLPSTILPADEARFHLYEALLRLLIALPVRPIILWMDDIHWADQATLDALGYLSDRLAQEPTLFVAALRPAELSPALQRQIAAWARAGQLRQLSLPALAVQEASRLAEAVGTDADQASRAHAASGGNPLYLIELSRAAGADSPSSLDLLIGARVGALPAADRQLLQAASVMTPPFDFEALGQVSALAESDLLDGLDRLVNEGLLAESDVGYRFAHPILSQVVQEGLGSARHRVLHRRAAEALEARVGDQPRFAIQLADHWQIAGDSARAAAYAEQAGHYDLSLSAPDEAERAFARAMALEPTPARALGRAQAVLMMRGSPAADEALHAALAMAEAAGDRQVTVQAYQMLAIRALPIGQPDEVIRWAERSLEMLDATREHELHAQAHQLLGAGYLQQGRDMARAERHLAEAERLATTHRLPSIAARAHFERGNLLAERGDLPGAVDRFLAAAELARGAGDTLIETLAWNNAAYHQMLQGNLPRAMESIERALALAEGHAFVGPPQYLYSTRGEIAVTQGALDDAKQWFERAWSAAEAVGNQRQLANVEANQALLARERGDMEEARTLLLSARERVATVRDLNLEIKIELWLADVARSLADSSLQADALARAKALLDGSDRSALRAQWQALSA